MRLRVHRSDTLFQLTRQALSCEGESAARRRSTRNQAYLQDARILFRRKDPFRSSLPPLPTELVTVFRASDASTIMIAESILRSAQVDFLTLGGDAEHRWSSPAGIPVYGRQIEFQVRREDLQDAVSLLADLQAEVDAGDSPPAWDESDDETDDGDESGPA